MSFCHSIVTNVSLSSHTKYMILKYCMSSFSYCKNHHFLESRKTSGNDLLRGLYKTHIFYHPIVLKSLQICLELDFEYSNTNHKTKPTQTSETCYVRHQDLSLRFRSFFRCCVRYDINYPVRDLIYYFCDNRSFNIHLVNTNLDFPCNNIIFLYCVIIFLLITLV